MVDGVFSSMKNQTAQELRIARLKQVREQSRRVSAAKTAAYNSIRDANRESKYQVKRAAKLKERRKVLRDLNSNWQASLLATGGAHRASEGAAINTERVLEQQKAIKRQLRVEAINRGNSAAVVARQESLKRRMREIRALHVKASREDASAHDREDARANGDVRAAALQVAENRRQYIARKDPNTFTTRVPRAQQRAISVLDRGPVYVDACVVRHNDVGAEMFSVQNAQTSFEHDGVRKFHAQVMAELLANVSSKVREKEARQKASRKAHSHTIDDDLQTLLTMDRAQLRMSRIKSAEQIAPMEESPKLITKFEKVFLKETEDSGEGFERNQENANVRRGASIEVSEPVVAKKKGVKAVKGDLLDAVASLPPAARKTVPVAQQPSVLAPPTSLARGGPPTGTPKAPAVTGSGIPLAWEVQDPDATFGSVDVPTTLVGFDDSVFSDGDYSDGLPVPTGDVIAAMRAKVNAPHVEEDVGGGGDFGKTMRPEQITAQIETTNLGNAPTLMLSLTPETSRSHVNWNDDEPNASFTGGGEGYDDDEDNSTNSSASTNVARHDSIISPMAGLEGAGVVAGDHDQFADMYREEFDEMDEDGVIMRRPVRAASGGNRGVTESQDSWDEMFGERGRNDETGGPPPADIDFDLGDKDDDLDAFLEELDLEDARLKTTTGVGSSTGMGMGMKVSVAGSQAVSVNEVFMESPDDEDDDDDEDYLSPPPTEGDDDDEALDEVLRQSMAARGATVRSSVRSSYGDSDLVEGELDELSRSWLEKQQRNADANTSVSVSESDGPSVPPSPALWDLPSPSPARRPSSEKRLSKGYPSPRALRARNVEARGASSSSSSSAVEQPSSGTPLEESQDSLFGNDGAMPPPGALDTAERSRAAIMAELGAARASLMDMANEEGGGGRLDDTLDMGDGDEPTSSSADKSNDTVE